MIQETALKSLKRGRSSHISVMLILLNWFSVFHNEFLAYWVFHHRITMDFFSLHNCDDDVILIQFFMPGIIMNIRYTIYLEILAVKNVDGFTPNQAF